jgi:hypothetical protein
MDFDADRRRFLQLAGTGTAASLAGCSALQETLGSQQGDGTGTETGAGGDQRVAVAVQADQQALQRRQQEIRSALSSGNISRSEAQTQYRSAQEDLRSEAVASFAERADSNADLTVADSIDRFGLVLVGGSPAALLGTLSSAEVNALLPQATFQQAKSQAQQRPQRGNGTSTTSN